MRAATLVWCVLLGCSDPAPRTHEVPAEPGPAPAPRAVSLESLADPDPELSALPRIDDAAAWRRLAARSDEHAIARTEVVKVLYDRAHETLHFMQTVRWPLHYPFVVQLHPEVAERHPTAREFAQRNYFRDDREYVMGSIVHYLDQDAWSFELGPADTLPAEQIAALLDRIRAQVFFGEALRFHPRSAHQIAAAAAAGLPVLDAEALWRGVRYQPLTLGSVVGRVRTVRGALDGSTVRDDEILVVAETPADLPLVRALVTAELQTPLAHVAVLSESRGTPNMALRGVLDDPDWQAFEGALARLTVGTRGYTLEAVAADEPVAPTARVEIAPVDRAHLALIALGAASLDDVSRIGAKAAQLAEVRRLGLTTADGFVVPMAQYLAHLERHDLAAHAALPADRAARERALTERRAAITAAPIDPALVRAIVRRTTALGAPRVLLRSSTNAEDLPGFSGAGLYDSVAADAGDPADVARALGEVWASMETLRAVDARERAGIAHEDVAMAVLVQPLLEDVRAFGVAITTNPHSTVRPGYLVDLAPATGSVTATTDARPEEWILYLHSAPELSSASSASETLLLDGPACLRLRGRLAVLDEGLRAVWAARGITVDAVDAELAIARDGSVVFLQARPYTRHR